MILQDKSSNIAGLQDIIKVKEELIQNLKQQIETLQNQYQAQLSTKDETIAALQAQIQDIMNYAREYNISGTIYFDEQKTAEKIKNRLTKAILDAFK